jgi:hypothetical protein
MPSDSTIRFYLFSNRGWLEVVAMTEERAAELCTEGTVYDAAYTTRREADAKRRELNVMNMPIKNRARRGVAHRQARKF